VILSGVQPQPQQVLAKGNLRPMEGKLAICTTLEEAALLARGKRRTTAEIIAAPASIETKPAR
jgi:hypothetical protein